LNGFVDITTNELALGIDIILFSWPQVVVYSSRNTLFLKCDNPKLLGDKVEVFSTSGQLIKSSGIEQMQLNSIDVNVNPGIYFCRYQFDGKTQTQKVVFMR